jgi:hypothetical protein
MTSPDDIQTVELVTPPGYDANPIDGSLVYIQTIGESYKIGYAVNDGITPTLATGETGMHSLNDAGAIQAFIKLLKTGIIEINGNADFAVRFTALNSALQSMLTDLNNDIISAGGTGGTTLDISGAKVDEVKLP